MDARARCTLPDKEEDLSEEKDAEVFVPGPVLWCCKEQEREYELLATNLIANTVGFDNSSAIALASLIKGMV